VFSTRRDARMTSICTIKGASCQACRFRSLAWADARYRARALLSPNLGSNILTVAAVPLPPGSRMPSQKVSLVHAVLVASCCLVVVTDACSSALVAEAPRCDKSLSDLLSTVRKFSRFGVVGPFTIDRLDDPSVGAARMIRNGASLEQMKSKYASGDQFYFLWVGVERGPILWEELLLARNDCLIEAQLVIIG
jgi:hypothetical protein